MFVILGAGQQSKAIIRYLNNHVSNHAILVIDKIPFQNQSIDNPNKRVVYHQAPWPITNKSVYNEVLSTINNMKNTSTEQVVVINCLPLHMFRSVIEFCLQNKFHYTDLGGDIENTKYIESLDEQATDAGIYLIPDCGVAPGLVSCLAKEYQLQQYDSVEIYCGGIPVNPKLPLGYLKSFSTKGLIQEYSGDCKWIKNKRKKTVKALSSIEQVFIPSLGVLEASPTSGSLSTTPEQKHLFSNLSYRTLRYPGHWQYISKYIQPPIELFDQCKEPSSSDPDVLVLMIKGQNLSTNKKKMNIYFWNYDFQNNLSAMQQATGYTVSAVAKMIINNEIDINTNKDYMNGCRNMHDLDFPTVEEYIKLEPNQMLEPFSNMYGHI